MKWEYKQIDYNYVHTTLLNEFNLLGADGWELCAIDNTIYNSPKFYFKRPI